MQDKGKIHRTHRTHTTIISYATDLAGTWSFLTNTLVQGTQIAGEKLWIKLRVVLQASGVVPVVPIGMCPSCLIQVFA